MASRLLGGRVPGGERAREQGGIAGVINITALSITWIVAPVSATALYGWMPLSPFLLALSLVALSCACAWWLLHRRQAAPLRWCPPSTRAALSRYAALRKTFTWHSKPCRSRLGRPLRSLARRYGRSGRAFAATDMDATPPAGTPIFTRLEHLKKAAAWRLTPQAGPAARSTS